MSARQDTLHSPISPLQREHVDSLAADLREAVWALGEHLDKTGAMPSDAAALVIGIALQDLKKIVMGWNTHTA